MLCFYVCRKLRFAFLLAEGLQPPADFLTQSFKNKTVSVTWRQAPYGIVPKKFIIHFKPISMPDSNSTTKTIIAQPPRPDTPADGQRYSQQIDVSNLCGSVSFWVTSVHEKTSQSSKKHNLVVGEGKSFCITVHMHSILHSRSRFIEYCLMESE